MFLFKNAKSRVKRIGLNMIVYGFAVALVMRLVRVYAAPPVATVAHGGEFVFTVLMIVGAFVSLVGLVIEFVTYLRAPDAPPHDPVCKTPFVYAREEYRESVDMVPILTRLIAFFNDNHYTITEQDNTLTVHTPPHEYLTFIAKQDGVYTQMDNQPMKKRLSCRDGQVASFVVLAYLFIKHSHDPAASTLLNDVRQYVTYALVGSEDVDQGHWLINSLATHFTAPPAASDTFVCAVCGKTLPLKHRHHRDICAACAPPVTTPAPRRAPFSQPLTDMKNRILADCYAFGVNEQRIASFLKNELCQDPVESGDHTRFAYNLNGNDGFSVTHYERGRCNFGFGSKDPTAFRFLFQLYTVHHLHNFAVTDDTKARAEVFMKKAYPLFGDTAEYQQALDRFVRVWADFEGPDDMARTNAQMAAFLRTNGYTVTFDVNSLTVNEDSDDPWHVFDAFIAKGDGVYNHIEVQMGGYDLKKRLSCDDLTVASFVVLAYVFTRCPAHRTVPALRREVKRLLPQALAHTRDHDRGQWLITHLTEQTAPAEPTTPAKPRVVGVYDGITVTVRHFDIYRTVSPTADKKISVTEAKEIEIRYRTQKAFVHYAKSALPLEDALAHYGFVRHDDGQWFLKHYDIDDHRAYLKRVPACAPTPLSPLEMLLYQDGVPGEDGNMVSLQFSLDGEMTVIERGWWRVSRGSSNGGECRHPLPRDYFCTNTLADFITWLTDTCGKDVSSIRYIPFFCALFMQRCRPRGSVEVVRTVDEDIRPADGAAFSFEKKATVIAVVRAEKTLFLRKTDYECSAGANGRPLYSLFERYYPVTKHEADTVTAQNGAYKMIAPLYEYKEYDQGVRF